MWGRLAAAAAVCATSPRRTAACIRTNPIEIRSVKKNREWAPSDLNRRLARLVRLPSARVPQSASRRVAQSWRDCTPRRHGQRDRMDARRSTAACASSRLSLRTQTRMGLALRVAQSMLVPPAPPTFFRSSGGLPSARKAAAPTQGKHGARPARARPAPTPMRASEQTTRALTPAMHLKGGWSGA